MFSHRLNHIKQTGLRAGMKEDDARKIMVVNFFSFLTAMLCTFCGVSMTILSGSWTILFTALGFVCGFLGVLLLNRHQRFAAAKFSLQLVFCLVMLYYGCLFGESTQVEFLGLFLIGVPLLICSSKQHLLRFVCLLMPLLTLFLLETNYYYAVIPPMELDRGNTFLFRWLIMIVVVILNFVVITYYQHNLQGLLKRLHRRHASLQKRNLVVQQKEAELMNANRELENYSERLERVVEQRTRELKEYNLVQDDVLSKLNVTLSELTRKETELEAYVDELEVLKGNLLKARDDAEKANAAKSTFLRELSHEIRNPLNAIMGISYLLLNDRQHYDSMPDNIVNYIENINNSGRNLLEIINNVLELARIEAGKADAVRREPFILREWVYNVAGVYQNAARLKEVSIHVQIDHKLPEQLLGDRVYLSQVVNNLLGNAIKFTPEHKKVTLSCYRHSTDAWCIRVTDEGEGIPCEKQAQLFKPFEQADNTIHQRFGGTGLGLAISKRLAELLGGHISLWSEPGTGTSFTVTLPLIPHHQPIEAEKTIPVKNKGKEVQQLFSGQKILLMEDSAMNRMVMQEFFQFLDVPLLTANDGLEGLELARQHLPDMIIMDMHMPRLDGITLIRTIRQDALLQHIPLIVISADAFREQQEIALRAGVNEYLIKPVLLDELRKVLDKYLRSAPMPVKLEVVTC